MEFLLVCWIVAHHIKQGLDVGLNPPSARRRVASSMPSRGRYDAHDDAHDVLVGDDSMASRRRDADRDVLGGDRSDDVLGGDCSMS
jgi:hypothetical protein